MAKRDYTDPTVRIIYKGLIKTNRDSKVSVDSEDKRSRAELLDAIEDLFQSGAKSISPDKIRAFLTMLVLSTKNSTDDK